jgi:hypothetical protein
MNTLKPRSCLLLMSLVSLLPISAHAEPETPRQQMVTVIYGRLTFIDADGRPHHDKQIRWSPGMTVISVIVAAGGVSNPPAYGSCRLVRGTETLLKVRVDKLDASNDHAVEPGDIVYID